VTDEPECRRVVENAASLVIVGNALTTAAMTGGARPGKDQSSLETVSKIAVGVVSDPRVVGWHARRGFCDWSPCGSNAAGIRDNLCGGQAPFRLGNDAIAYALDLVNHYLNLCHR